MTGTLSGDYRFPRELRLLTPTHFTFVFENAIPVSNSHFTILSRNNNLPNSRLGITVAKKRVKKAVARNRIKRAIRETFRLEVNNLPNVDIVVIAKSGCDSLSNEQLMQTLNQSWRRLKKRYPA